MFALLAVILAEFYVFLFEVNKFAKLFVWILENNPNPLNEGFAKFPIYCWLIEAFPFNFSFYWFNNSKLKVNLQDPRLIGT